MRREWAYKVCIQNELFMDLQLLHAWVSSLYVVQMHHEGMDAWEDVLLEI